MTVAGKPANRSAAGDPPTFGELTVHEMLDCVGAATPSPGGGAVAALVTALAAALAEMVAGYAVRKPGNSDDLAPTLLRATRSSRHRALRLADADADAYAAFTQRRLEHGQRPSDATHRKFPHQREHRTGKAP